MGKCKTKTSRTDLVIFRHNQAYSKLCVTLEYLELWYIQHSDTLEPEVYSELWYIQNPGVFITLAYSKSEAYLEPCQTSTMKSFSKIVNGYNYFCKLWLFSQYKLAAFSTSWNKYHEVATPEVVILCKKLWRTRGPGTVNFWYNYCCICS